jgi:hypothetical protein
MPPDLDELILIWPPLLKKYLASFAVGNEKVTVQEDCVIHEPVLDCDTAVVVPLSPAATVNLKVVISFAQTSY